MRRLAALGAVLALVVAAPAGAAGQRPSLLSLESQLVCVTCHETLNMSTSPLAEQMKTYIRRFIAEGWTSQQIIHWFVAHLGNQVLADPPTHGFNLLAWVIPFGVIGVGILAVGTGAWVWSRKRSEDEGGGAGVLALAGAPGLTPALDRRVDQELARFDG
jgi:cytochrome c-type biogenesis protein CcmH/NrfF